MRPKIILFSIIILLFTYVVVDNFVEAFATEHRKKSERIIAAPKTDLFHSAKKILILQGFNLHKADETSGVLSTKISPMRVVVDECECGSSIGPVEDTRPIIKVSVDIQVAENSVTVKVEIHGDYPKNQVTEAMIETDLLDQISRYLK